MRKFLIVTVIIFINALSGFSTVIKPGWNYARIPTEALSGISDNVGSFHVGVQFSLNILPVSSLHLSAIYNPRYLESYGVYNSEGVFLGTFDLNATNMFINFGHRFTIPLQTVKPYFSLGAAFKFGFWDFASDDKNTWNVTASHGYKIRLNSHLSLMPEALVYYQLTSPSKFYAIMINLGLCYDI